MTEKTKIIDFNTHQYIGILIAATVIGCVLTVARYAWPGLELFFIGYCIAIAAARIRWGIR